MDAVGEQAGRGLSSWEGVARIAAQWPEGSEQDLLFNISHPSFTPSIEDHLSFAHAAISILGSVYPGSLIVSDRRDQLWQVGELPLSAFV